MKYLIYTAIILLILVAYSYIFSGFDPCLGRLIVGKYHYGEDETMGQIIFSGDQSRDDYSYETILTASVFAYGCNDFYIIAKQHPDFSMSHANSSKSITNYYIVPVYNIINDDSFSQNPSKYRFGPMTLDSFTKKCHELHIDSLKFQHVCKCME